MEAITQFKANDGEVFNTAQEAVNRDQLIVDVTDAMSVLKREPENYNGETYVQQSLDSVLECKKRLYALVNREGFLKSTLDNQKKAYGYNDDFFIATADPGWFGRMLDGSHAPLGRAYRRLCSIDGQGREWGQPYYANHPNPNALEESLERETL